MLIQRPQGLPASVTCLHPKSITRKDGERITVKCGKCEACRLGRLVPLQNSLDQELQYNKYNYFILLTYNQTYIPLFSYIKDKDGYTGFDIDTGEVLFQNYSAKERTVQREARQHVSPISGTLPYLRRSDVQKFIKRVRFHASKLDEKPLRVFYVGEYGPTNGRPHYHVTLSTNSESIANALRNIVYKAWKYGYIGFRTAYSGASGYVAGYVSRDGAGTGFYSQRCLGEFRGHSNALGLLQFSEREFPEVGQGRMLPKYDFINEHFVNANGKLRRYFPPLSFAHTFVPRCFNYEQYDDSQRFRLYISVLQFLGCTGSYKAFQEEVFRRFAQKETSAVRLFALLKIRDNYSELSSNEEGLKYIDNKLSSCYYVSRNFVLASQKFNYSYERYYQFIKEYYSRKSYIGLVKQLTEQEEFGDVSDDLDIWYPPKVLDPYFTPKIRELATIFYRHNYHQLIKKSKMSERASNYFNYT